MTVTYSGTIGGQNVGQLSRSRGAQRATERPGQRINQGFDFANQNYQDRTPFRQAAGQALNQPQFDWQSYYDPSAFQEPDIAYGNGQDTGRNASESAFQGVQGIDREKMVREALANFDKESAPILENQYRGAASRAAALGAVGSGGLNTELGEFTARRGRDRDVLESSAITDAESGAIEDKYRLLNAAQQREGILKQQNDDAYARALDAARRKTSLKQGALSARLDLGNANRQDSQSNLSRILGLGQFGYGNDPSGAAFQAAGLKLNENQQNEAAKAAKAKQWSDFLGTLGQGAGYFLGGGGGGGFAPSGAGTPYAGPNYGSYG